jgi:hypothetical protein
MCLKDWIDTDVRDQYHSNMYDISEYRTSIYIFFVIRTTLIFFIYFSNFI